MEKKAQQIYSRQGSNKTLQQSDPARKNNGNFENNLNFKYIFFNLKINFQKYNRRNPKILVVEKIKTYHPNSKLQDSKQTKADCVCWTKDLSPEGFSNKIITMKKGLQTSTTYRAPP